MATERRSYASPYSSKGVNYGQCRQSSGESSPVTLQSYILITDTRVDAGRPAWAAKQRLSVAMAVSFRI